MKQLYRYDEQARHPHLPEEHYFQKLNPFLVYVGTQGGMPGAQNVLHTHRFLELAFIVQGAGQVLIDGNMYPVTAGDILVFDAGCVHCEYSDADDPLLFYFAAYDKVSLPGLQPGCLLPAGAVPLLHTGNAAEGFACQFKEALQELENGRDFGYEIAQAAARIILMRLYRLLYTAEGAKTALQPNRTLQQAMRFIDENYTAQLSLETVAEHCRVSKFHLAHLFTRYTGQSVGKYILSRRVQRAKHLLGSTDQPIEQIALRCGFTDSAYFCRQFKKETGETPSGYRSKAENLNTD